MLLVSITKISRDKIKTNHMDLFKTKSKQKCKAQAFDPKARVFMQNEDNVRSKLKSTWRFH